MSIADDIARLEALAANDPAAQDELDRLLMRTGLPKRRIAKLLERQDLPSLYVDEDGRIVHASALTNLWTDADGAIWGRFDATTAPDEIAVSWPNIESAYTLPEVAVKEWQVPRAGWRGSIVLRREPGSDRYEVLLVGPNGAEQSVAKKRWEDFASFSFVHHKLRPLPAVIKEFEKKGVAPADVLKASPGAPGLADIPDLFDLPGTLTKWAIGFALVGIVTGIIAIKE